jgi:tRNA(Ile)-lysidine synthase
VPAGLVARVRRAIREHGLLAPGERGLVAVSGGPDSVALLGLLAALAGKLRVALAVGHVDHGLRGEEGRAAAALVARLAADACLPFVEARLSSVLTRSSGQPSEAALRRARYAALARLAREARCGVIAVGHSREDQAETVLLRLLRGAGPRGLAGMAPLRSLPDRDGGPPLRLIRPLLGIARSDLAAWVAERGLPTHPDPTNMDRRWLRNALRLDFLPALRARVNPRLDEALAATAAILRDEDAFVAAEAAERLERLATRPVGGGDVRLETAALAVLPVALQRRILRLAGEAAAPGAPQPSFAQVEEARRLLMACPSAEAERSGAEAERSRTAEAERSRRCGGTAGAAGPVRWPGGLAVALEAGVLVVGRRPRRLPERRARPADGVRPAPGV